MAKGLSGCIQLQRGQYRPVLWCTAMLVLFLVICSLVLLGYTRPLHVASAAFCYLLSLGFRLFKEQRHVRLFGPLVVFAFCNNAVTVPPRQDGKLHLRNRISCSIQAAAFKTPCYYFISLISPGSSPVCCCCLFVAGCAAASAAAAGRGSGSLA